MLIISRIYSYFILEGMNKTAGTEDYSPVPVLITRSEGVGFSVILFTDSRLLSSAMFAYMIVLVPQHVLYRIDTRACVHLQGAEGMPATME